MKEISPSPDTFNARWSSPEGVAETFVPIPQFRLLAQNSHSLLLGPRGCGKTTLLKMLTRRAQEKWQASGRDKLFNLKFNAPEFEAVYIPSDVRWSYELRSIPQSDPELRIRVQRIMVGLNAIFQFLGTVRDLVGITRVMEKSVCEQLIRRLSLKEMLPTFRDIRCGLEEIAGAIRGTVRLADDDKLEKALAKMPAFLFGHAFDSVVSVLHFVSEYLDDSVRPQQWALCYDELEIAPDWLRQELVAALRSGPQDVILKLTWFPILPSGVPTSPGLNDDFRAIRLWHSHVEDPKEFCEDLTREFLQRKFGSNSPTPAKFFSRSLLAAEEDDAASRAYEEGSTEYWAFLELAKWDKPFRAALVQRGIDPEHPVPRNQEEKDQFFRKVKPIVLLRNEFADEFKYRSRKAPALYVGREAIYAISEGNPRWLLSILEDLIAFGEPNPSDRSALSVAYSTQGKILTNASNRLRALIKSSPFKLPDTAIGAADHTLLEFIDLLGKFFREAIHNRGHFSEDPTGSFIFPEQANGLYLAMVSQLLEIGALVYVGASQQDVPNSVQGSRFRLSFMLAPIYRLAFRNFKAVSLREILLRRSDDGQLRLGISL